MCVIVHQPAGTSLEKDRAQRLWDKNDDGAGIGYLDRNNRWRIHKMMDFRRFWATYRSTVTNFPERDILVHMRIATHGEICTDNNHPFIVNDSTIVAHNGVLRWVPLPPKGDNRSDTRMFVDRYLKALPELWLDNAALREIVEEAISGSKMVLYTNNPELSSTVYILNESAGKWVDGMWFSNTWGVNPVAATTWSKGDWNRPFLASESKAPEGDIWVGGLGTWYKTGEGQWKLNPEKQQAKLPAPYNAKSYLEKEEEAATIRTKYGYTAAPLFVESGLICSQCEGEIKKEEDFNCLCYNMVCMDCLEEANDCACEYGISKNLAQWTPLVENTIQNLRTLREGGDVSAPEPAPSNTVTV